MKVRCINAKEQEDVLREGSIYEGELKYDHYFSEDRWEIKGFKGARFKKHRFEEVKQLTFKEVIENIKDRESYRAIYERGLGNRPTITRNQNSIEIDFLLKTDCYFFTGDMLFELVRKAYTFEEAFKALEEGKEIESSETHERLKLKDGRLVYFDSYDGRFNHADGIEYNEIKGKWYIND